MRPPYPDIQSRLTYRPVSGMLDSMDPGQRAVVSAPSGTTSPVPAAPAIVLIGSRPVGPAPSAVWLTAAGWAEAAARHFGQVLMVTSAGRVDPSEARGVATTPKPQAEGSPRRRRRLGVLRDLAKDMRELVRALRFTFTANRAAPRGTTASLVWQHHEPWLWAGWWLARRCHAPWVLFVDAPVVWESRAWGVRRPGWGRMLERFGEVPQLRRADVVACVSESVATEVRRLGAPSDRVVVTPCSVDVTRYDLSDEAKDTTRRTLGLEGRVVVGWLGSFRRFHGIDMLLESYERARTSYPKLALLLIGDGPERRPVEEDVRRRGLKDVVLTGMVHHDDVPRNLGAVDIAVIIDPGSAQWHYSPLKLREYMAAGLAIIAPDSGQVRDAVRDEHEALLVPPGDGTALATAISALAGDASHRARLGAAARARSEGDGGWDRQLASALTVAEPRSG